MLSQGVGGRMRIIYLTPHGAKYSKPSADGASAPDAGAPDEHFTAEEVSLAHLLYKEMRRLAPAAVVSGDPQNEDGPTLVDGHFDLPSLVRIVLRNAPPSLR